MTTTRIIDLDALVPDPRQVKLGGVVYELPGDMPLEIFLRVNKAAQAEADDGEGAMVSMIGALVDLFGWENAAVDKDAISSVINRRGVRAVMSMLQDIYSDPEPEREELPGEGIGTEEVPPQTPASTTSSEESGEPSSAISPAAATKEPVAAS